MNWALGRSDVSQPAAFLPDPGSTRVPGSVDHEGTLTGRGMAVVYHLFCWRTVHLVVGLGMPRRVNPCDPVCSVSEPCKVCKSRAYRRKYYEDHLEQLTAYHATRYRESSDRPVRKVFGSEAERADARRRYSKIWRKANPERAREIDRARHWKRRAQRVAASRFKNTGHTAEYFNACLERQGWKCAITGCGAVLTLEPRVAMADHCHSANKPRAVLCNRCNSALGAIEHPLADAWRSYAQEWSRAHDADELTVAKTEAGAGAREGESILGVDRGSGEE